MHFFASPGKDFDPIAASEKSIAPPQDPVGVLVRQIDQAVEKVEEEKKQKTEAVPYSKLYSLESGTDKCYRFLGWGASIIAGLAMPSFVYFMGDIVDTFDPSEGVASTLDDMKKLALIMVFVGLGLWLFSYVFFAMLLIFSAKVARKVRVAYLRSVLRQEVAWFDEINP